MDYGKLFSMMFPGFFDDEGIRSKPEDRVYSELVMDLHKEDRKSVV